MKTKLGKKIERLAGTYPRRPCPYCKYKFERVSRYCNMCGARIGEERKHENKLTRSGITPGQERGCWMALVGKDYL